TVQDYVLIHGAGAASALNAGTWQFASQMVVFNNTSYVISGTIVATANDLILRVTSVVGQTPLGTAFWKGNLTGGAQVWDASNGTTASNFLASIAQNGLNQVLVPGSGTDLIFTTQTTTGGANATGSTLGTDMSIRSFTYNDGNYNFLLD